MELQNITTGPVGTGVTVGNSGGASGDPFDVVTLGTNGVLTYDIKEGMPCLKAQVVDWWQSQGNVRWDVSGDGVTRCAGRIQLYVPSPGVVDPDYPPSGAGRANAYVRIGPFGFGLYTFDRGFSWPAPRPDSLVGVGPNGILFSDGIIPLDQWFRIEWDVTCPGPFEYDVKLFHNLTTTTPLNSWSGWQSLPGHMSAPMAIATVELGPSNAGAPSLWYGNVQINDTAMPGPGPQPDTLPYMSTLADAFPNINADKWTPTGPVSSVAGAAQLGDDTLSGYLASVDSYLFDSAQVEVHAAGRGMMLWVDAVDSADFLKIAFDHDTGVIRGEWFVDGTGGNTGDDTMYEPENHRYLKIRRDGATDGVAFLVSGDGLEWTALGDGTSAVYERFQIAKAILVGNLATSLDNFNIAVAAPADPEIPDELVDPFDPDAILPPLDTDPGGPGADPDDPDAVLPTCKTVLELVRAFSAAIGRPVRITGPTSIELVDINAPLPTGWTVADAADAYTTTTHELIAGEQVLSLERGSLNLNVSADLVSDDVRLIVSDWQLPEQLPIFGLAAGLVKAVSYEFTPQHFRGSVEYHLRPVPLSIRRR